MIFNEFRREQAATLLDRAQQYPVVTVTGPRQSGKTTLCRHTFPDKPYANLEQPDTREFARQDPRGFLAGFPEGAVLDEIQRVPELLSWIQVMVDEQPQPGRFILTGSHQFELARNVSQTLAGRTALLRLLPLSLSELTAAGEHQDVDTAIWRGGYPRIHRDKLPPAVALGDYFETYVQRDLRELLEVRRIDQFERFVRLAAGRIGQPLNLNALGADAGVSGHTAKEWLSVLEASFVVFRLPPWFANIGKRLVKTPKLYFVDTGLAAWLLNIRERDHVVSHPLRGNLFENLVVKECLKHFLNRGERTPLYFYRDSSGTEVDLLLESGNAIRLVEIKSSQTINPEFFRSLQRVGELLGERVTGMALVHGGDELQQRNVADRPCRLVPWERSGTAVASQG